MGTSNFGNISGPIYMVGATSFGWGNPSLWNTTRIGMFISSPYSEEAYSQNVGSQCWRIIILFRKENMLL